MKKTIMPVKYVFILTGISLIGFPLLLYLGARVVSFIFTLGNAIVPHYVIFVGIPFGVIEEIMFLIAPKHCKLIIENGTVSNWINDGTQNDGWCESISDIKKIEVVGKEEIQKYYKQFKKSKAILIDFGNGNVKYIYAGWFSKRQIKQIMDILNNK